MVLFAMYEAMTVLPCSFVSLSPDTKMVRFVSGGRTSGDEVWFAVMIKYGIFANVNKRTMVCQSRSVAAGRVCAVARSAINLCRRCVSYADTTG